ncbi:hypothetical protein Hdeb2414_s0006g00196861 [Helianthus debilis subsp. tardiflorus]
MTCLGSFKRHLVTSIVSLVSGGPTPRGGVAGAHLKKNSVIYTLKSCSPPIKFYDRSPWLKCRESEREREGGREMSEYIAIIAI